MQFITDFGDEAVILPAMAMVACGLAIARWWRGLGAWLFAVPGVLGTMALLKYVCFACSPVFAAYGVNSPSGHTAASTVVYGGLLLLVLRRRLPLPMLALIPLVIAICFAITRLVLHAHDLAEVFIGAAVGLEGVAILLLLAGPLPTGLKFWPIVTFVLVAVAGFHGVRLHAELALHYSPLFTWLPLPSVCRA